MFKNFAVAGDINAQAIGVKTGERALKRVVSKYGLIKFREAVEEILSIADLFIIPSETESFGLAALEAMACEVPVISTNTGGLKEVNIDGVTGFTSDVGDTTKMAKDALHILKEENNV